MPIIHTEKLSKAYGKLTAVAGLDLDVEEGEVFGLLGPNGAGKTTIIMMLTTLRQPSSGRATVNGFDIAKESSKVRKSVGIVFQDPSSDEILTGSENLKLHGMLYDMPDDLAAKRIDEVLNLVDLADRKNDLVKKYSGGMRRRLELARGLMHHPKVLFLDEPTLGLDPQTREHIWNYIRKLAKEEKITIIITTHYMDEADRLCDRIAIIDHGKIVALDSPENLKKELGGETIRLETAKPNIKALEKLKCVKSIKILDGEVFLTVSDANKNLQKILEAAGKVSSVEVRSPKLEDVFLHYTGRTIRKDAPEGSWVDKAMHARSNNK